MGTAIKLYAIETEELGGRAFNLTDYELSNKTPYQGIQLFREASLAQKEVADDIEHGTDEEEIGVIAVFVHADGKITDHGGANLLTHISRQSNISEADLQGYLVNFHKNESAELRRNPSISI